MRDRLEQVKQRLGLPPGAIMVPQIGGPQAGPRPPTIQERINDLRERTARELFFRAMEPTLSSSESAHVLECVPEDQEKEQQKRRLAYRSTAVCCLEAADEFTSMVQQWWYEAPAWCHPNHFPKEDKKPEVEKK